MEFGVAGLLAKACCFKGEQFGRVGLAQVQETQALDARVGYRGGPEAPSPGCLFGSLVLGDVHGGGVLGHAHPLGDKAARNWPH